MNRAEAFKKWNQKYFSAGISHEMWTKVPEDAFQAGWEAALLNQPEQAHRISDNTTTYSGFEDAYYHGYADGQKGAAPAPAVEAGTFDALKVAQDFVEVYGTYALKEQAVSHLLALFEECGVAGKAAGKP